MRTFRIIPTYIDNAEQWDVEVLQENGERVYYSPTLFASMPDAVQGAVTYLPTLFPDRNYDAVVVIEAEAYLLLSHLAKRVS